MLDSAHLLEPHKIYGRLRLDEAREHHQQQGHRRDQDQAHGVVSVHRPCRCAHGLRNQHEHESDEVEAEELLRRGLVAHRKVDAQIEDGGEDELEGQRGQGLGDVEG